MKLGKKIFHFTSKALFVLENQILEIWIFKLHDVIKCPKHKTRNTFYWITWETNTVCQWDLASLYHITKEKFLSKKSTKTATWKQVPGPFVFVKNYAQPLLETEVFEANHLDMS